MCYIGKTNRGDGSLMFSTDEAFSSHYGCLTGSQWHRTKRKQTMVQVRHNHKIWIRI